MSRNSAAGRHKREERASERKRGSPLSTSQPSVAFEDDLPPAPAWKQEVNARLDAHRTRRSRVPRSLDAQPALPGMENAVPVPPAQRAARVAARVAERYATAPSYREMLAVAAPSPAQEATHAAEPMVATESASSARVRILPAEPPAEFEVQSAANPDGDLFPSAAPVRYHIHPGSLPAPRSSLPTQAMPEPARVRISEICDPFEDAVITPAQPLPVRILEFPRELVAARKARPRHAEGPLRDAPPSPERSQLRIFEVESEAISREAAPAELVEQHRLPEWHSIRLDAQPVAQLQAQKPIQASAHPAQRHTIGAAQGRSGIGAARPGLGAPVHQAAGSNGEPQGRNPNGVDDPDQPHSPLLDLLPLHVASIEDRLMAGIVDLALVLIAFLLFVLVFVACTAHPPIGKPALMYAGIALVSFFAFYQWLFFTYADGTPGMRYAQIALCTFDDENPTRKATQGRVAALFLSAVPMGLGFLWALFDDDRLGWHDRITRTYQRSYR
jgi:uncharacterized RDD family membrane protein YckC